MNWARFPCLATPFLPRVEMILGESFHFVAYIQAHAAYSGESALHFNRGSDAPTGIELLSGMSIHSHSWQGFHIVEMID